MWKVVGLLKDEYLSLFVESRVENESVERTVCLRYTYSYIVLNVFVGQTKLYIYIYCVEYLCRTDREISLNMTEYCVMSLAG